MCVWYVHAHASKRTGRSAKPTLLEIAGQKSVDIVEANEGAFRSSVEDAVSGSPNISPKRAQDQEEGGSDGGSSGREGRGDAGGDGNEGNGSSITGESQEIGQFSSSEVGAIMVNTEKGEGSGIGVIEEMREVSCVICLQCFMDAFP